MRAAVYYGNSTLSVEDAPEPDVKDGHVKVRVSRKGICRTDLHEYDIEAESHQASEHFRRVLGPVPP